MVDTTTCNCKYQVTDGFKATIQAQMQAWVEGGEERNWTHLVLILLGVTMTLVANASTRSWENVLEATRRNLPCQKQPVGAVGMATVATPTKG